MRGLCIILILSCFACAQFEAKRAYEKLVNLEGMWCFSMDSLMMCEQWTKLKNGNYKGNGYQVERGDTTFTEELRISKSKNNLTYSAKVYLQNDAQWIDFDLRTNVDDVMIFENQNHDFPKQIRVQFPSRDEMKIYILGDNDDGFSHQFTRQ